MAILSNDSREEIREEFARKFSQSNTEIPIIKDDLQALINFMDSQLETTESDIFNALPDSDGKNWLLANQSIGRDLLARVEQKRQESL